jgi:hypothetical protein
MNGSTPQHYTIADFLKWHDDQELILNPKFQRGSVWPPEARSYLIDSLLRGYPIPKLLLRTTVDRDNRRTLRDVVDGQQRLRTIIDFSAGRFILGKKAHEFAGMRYADLDDDVKDSFLSYKVTCEQLINADDDDVLEVFLRINSYAVPVNEPELRNAKYENDFSETVKAIARAVRPVWDLGVLSNRERVRMSDQSFVAEVLGFWMLGVTDGGESRITRLYEDYKNVPAARLPDEQAVVANLLRAASLASSFKNEPLVQRPHFLMLVAALMFAENVLPQGKLTFDGVLDRGRLLSDLDAVADALGVLNAGLSGESTAVDLAAFLEARTTMQRIKSRQTRFNFMCRALAGDLSG